MTKKVTDQKTATKKTAMPHNFRGRLLTAIRRREPVTSERFRLEAMIPQTVTAEQYRAALGLYRHYDFQNDRRRLLSRLFEAA